MKKVLILGIDGYIGYPLALHLLSKGFEVHGVDNFSRRRRVKEIDSNSLTPIINSEERINYLKTYSNFGEFIEYDLHIDPINVQRILKEIQPDTIVHLAEMPSAPWSMYDAERCNITQHENVLSTLNILWAIHKSCPNAHLVKLGTMGEYGCPNCDIPEGEIPEECIAGIEYKLSDLQSGIDKFTCPMQGLPFPRQPNSFYHLSKVHDTHNIIFACRNWGLRSTDIMQGVVFGLMNKFPSQPTRFDYDEYFGTVINRFCAQAIIQHPLTIYGKGYQTRGYLPLKDSIQCLTIAINNPPVQGEYRVFNQYESIYTINELANMVASAALSLNLHSPITYLTNPRKEKETHYYNPYHTKLFSLGYHPTTDIQGEILNLIKTLYPYHHRVNKKVILPKTKW